MSSDRPADPQKDTIAALAAALEEISQSDGSTFFDAEWEDQKAAVWSRALKLLDHRARSVGELRQRLKDLDLPTAVVNEVVEDLQRAGLLDDAHFAREWVRQRHHHKGKSRAVLRRELAEKLISAELQEEALAMIDDADERAVATTLAAKKARSVTVAPASYEEYQKVLRRIVGVLARRGYPQGMSLSVAREQLDQRIDDLGGAPGYDDD
ncbi:recombination regulator RecX [Corynebacterium sp. 13CS0277]|uniref:recombination regulator RecX n=1 Tax=Corynebacterium sp. 13CS0277 TaxID=2071994 RepID=UPI000D040D3F|nr:recombination regulator RecX [Corynebacterium sp. 13CS0277]PRQ10546.1 recombination regulator RecX [Corynebacterium sp. 13CS0277]